MRGNWRRWLRVWLLLLAGLTITDTARSMPRRRSTPLPQVLERFGPGSFNCAGFALGTYQWMSWPDTCEILRSARPLTSPDAPLLDGEMRVWLWTYLSRRITEDGCVESSHPDAHLVSGTCDSAGLVYSKSGAQPVEGPAAPASFRPSEFEFVGLNPYGQRVFVLRQGIVEQWLAVRPLSRRD